MERFLGNQVGSQLFDRLFNPILVPLQDWLDTHPFWNWLLTHPLWLVAAMILLLFLLAGLLGAIASLTEKIWLAILQAPVKLVQLIWWGTIALFKLPFTPKTTAAKSLTGEPDRLTIILERLEEIRAEQDELMQEMRSILAIQDQGKGKLEKSKPKGKKEEIKTS